MKRWTLSHRFNTETQQPQFDVRLTDAPWYLPLVENLGEGFHKITGHILCCNLPEWTNHVPIGKPKRDAEGDLDNSLGWYMWRLGQNISMLFWRHEKDVISLPISNEVAHTINPQWAADCDSIWADDDADAETTT